MPDSFCRLTVASCADDEHRAIDLELPADVDVGQLLPQIVDLFHRGTAPTPGLDWLLSRPGEPTIDGSTSLNDNNVRDGDVLLLTRTEPLVAEWTYCDPCHAATADPAPVPRILAAISCLLLGGFGAVALAWPAAGMAGTGRIVVATFLALASAAGAIVARRLHGDPLICMTLSLVAVVYAGALGLLTGRSGMTVSGLLLASAAMFAAAILLLRVTDCSRAVLSAIATSSALISAAAAANVAWELQPSAGSAALAALSLAMLGLAPRLAMAFSGTTPEAAPSVGRCHEILTGLVLGSSITAALGAAAAALGDGSPRGTVFSGIVALVLLLRVRTHVDASRRSGLAVAAVLCSIAGFASAAAALPAHVHTISALAATTGAAALGCIVRPTVSPIVLRTVEIIEYVALAAVIPIACWVGGIYRWAREMNLL